MQGLIAQKNADELCVENEKLKLSDELVKAFGPIFTEEQRKLMEEQRRLFGEWAIYRKKCIRTQVSKYMK